MKQKLQGLARMRKYVSKLMCIVWLIFPYTVFSTITLNGTTLELSGTVTANDILSSTHFTVSGNVVTPSYDTKLMTGVVLQLGGLIWNINDKDLIVEDTSNPPELSGVVIQIDSSVDHW